MSCSLLSSREIERCNPGVSLGRGLLPPLDSEVWVTETNRFWSWGGEVCDSYTSEGRVDDTTSSRKSTRGRDAETENNDGPVVDTAAPTGLVQLRWITRSVSPHDICGNDCTSASRSTTLDQSRRGHESRDLNCLVISCPIKSKGDSSQTFPFFFAPNDASRKFRTINLVPLSSTPTVLLFAPP